VQSVARAEDIAMTTRRACLTSFAALLALTATHPAHSQAWPQRPVRIVVPFSVGGNTDIIARIVAQRLGEAFGQQFVIENRAGASGAVAAELVARSAPDGHTLIMANVPQIAVLPATTKTPYDPVRDFAPISNIGTNPFVLAAHPSIPADSVAAFVDHVRAQPKTVTYASSGVGSMTFVTMALFRKRAGLDMIPVTYKGGAAPVADLVAGHVNSMFSNLSLVVPHATSGRLRLLGVTSEKRLRHIPHVPTFVESGFPGFRILTWNGLMAPAGTPKDIIDRIAGEIARAVKDPQFSERLAGDGFDPLGSSPQEFAATIAADIAFWADAVKAVGGQEQ
jgi:tripartite-type tricarboxylate transporter receptor subunit TctC